MRELVSVPHGTVCAERPRLGASASATRASGVGLQQLFDAADDIVDEEYAARSKGWLPAMRDSLAFKVAYAYGLRRRELAMLEYVDFGPNPHVPKYGGFGASGPLGKGNEGLWPAPTNCSDSARIRLDRRPPQGLAIAGWP